MSTPHALDVLSDAIADARPEDLAESRDRPPPAFRPYIRKPKAPNLANPCAECGGPHKGRAELMHATLLGGPGHGLVHFVSILPLCPPCAAMGRRHGWSALSRTWRRICSAPFELAELNTRTAQGGVQ